MYEIFYSVWAQQASNFDIFFSLMHLIIFHGTRQLISDYLPLFAFVLILASVVVLLSVDRSFHFFVTLHVNFFPYLATAIKGVEKKLTNLQIKIVIFAGMFHTSFGIKTIHGKLQQFCVLFQHKKYFMFPCSKRCSAFMLL